MKSASKNLKSLFYVVRATEVQKKIIEHYLTSGIKVALVDRNCITYILNHPAIYMKMQDMAVNEKVHNDFEMSNKIILLLEMIKYCESVGDKLLVFTSSIATLKYIEYVLSFMKSTWFTDGHTAKTNLLRDQWSWEKGEDFEIIDGTTKSVDRLKIQNNFKNKVLDFG
uniref:Uncharacterized protein n=1 Tax=Panagrolaimus superbus TaxID=310955 RepID=A0A914YFY1_9BILA